MIVEAKGWLRDHAGKVLVCGAGVVLTVSVVSLAMNVSGGNPAETDAQARHLITTLEGGLGKAQDDLTAKHEHLLAGLPGVDAKRADRDEAAGRSLLLGITDSSASTRGVRQTQALLGSRYPFLTSGSRVLADFVPEWMATTGATQHAGTTYKLGALDIDVSGVRGPDYGYIGLARLDPVTPATPNAAKSEYVLFGYSTTRDGTVTSLDACRASNRTRDAVAAEKQKLAGAGGRVAPGQDSSPPTGG